MYWTTGIGLTLRNSKKPEKVDIWRKPFMVSIFDALRRDGNIFNHQVFLLPQ